MQQLAVERVELGAAAARRRHHARALVEQRAHHGETDSLRGARDHGHAAVQLEIHDSPSFAGSWVERERGREREIGILGRGMATATAPVLDDARQQRRGQIYVALAAIAWSTAGVLQRQVEVDTATQVAGRAVFAGLSLLLYVAIVERGRVLHAFRSVGLAGVGVAVCIAIASGSFIAALNETSVARVLFMLAISPMLAAALAWMLLGEPVSRRSAFAMAMAFAGVAVMVGSPGGGNLTGDAIAFLTSIGFALALVITRHRRDVSMAPATILSQVLLVLVFAPFASASELGSGDLGWLALLGAGQIGLGLVLLTIGARLIPTAQVALISLLEVVLGPLWVWIALGERPDTATLIGGAIVIAAILVQTLGAPAQDPEVEGEPVAPP